MADEAIYTTRMGSGFPILMLHGFPLDHRSMLPFEGFLPEGDDNWQRCYIDLPGLGASQGYPGIGSSTDVLDALAEFIDREFKDRQFAVVGYSFGGLLASALAYRYGDRLKGIFMLAPELVPENDRRTLPKRSIHRNPDLRNQATRKELDAYRATAVVESPDNLAAFRKYIMPGLDANSGNKAIPILLDNPRLDKEPVEYLHGYTGTISLVVGKDDNMVGYEDAFTLYRSLGEATYTSLPKAGHTLHLDAPEPVGKAFRTWLKTMSQTIKQPSA